MVAIGGIADIVQHWHEMARSRMTRCGSRVCIAADEDDCLISYWITSSAMHRDYNYSPRAGESRELRSQAFLTCTTIARDICTILGEGAVNARSPTLRRT